MTKINLSELEQKAKASTPGPWHIFPENSYRENCHIILRTKSNFAVFTALHAKYEDSSFVASMNPATALALIRVARAARDYYFAPYCDDHECGCHEAHHEELKEALKEIEL